MCALKSAMSLRMMAVSQALTPRTIGVEIVAMLSNRCQFMIACRPLRVVDDSILDEAISMRQEISPYPALLELSRIKQHGYAWFRDSEFLGYIVMFPYLPGYLHNGWACPFSRSNFHHVSLIALKRPAHIGLLLRSFYPVYGFSRFIYPFILTGKPTTPDGLLFDRRIGMRPYSTDSKVWALPVPNKARLPFIRRS